MSGAKVNPFTAQTDLKPRQPLWGEFHTPIWHATASTTRQIVPHGKTAQRNLTRFPRSTRVASVPSLAATLTPRRARILLAAAFIVVAVGALFSAGLVHHLSPLGITNPSSGSAKADKLLEAGTGFESPPGLIALLDLGPPGHHRKGSKGAVMEGLARGFKIHQLQEAIEHDHHVGEVQSALDVGGALVSRNQRYNYLTVRFRPGSELAHSEEGTSLVNRLSHRRGVKFGSTDIGAPQSNEVIEQDLERAELFSFPILLLLTIWFFRGLVAALLPVVLGGTAIGLMRAGLQLVTNFLPISGLAIGIVSTLGIGLAIDYSLLIVSRFREELAVSPDDVHGAVVRAMATAGRTVMFSAVTVIMALGSLLVLPQQVFYSMGIGAILTALLVCISAVTILPALLLLLGPRVNALSPQWLQRSADTVSRPVLAGRWYRLATAVMRRPVTVAVCATAFLLLLAAPVLGIKFSAIGSATALPTSTSTRQVSDTIAANFKLDPEHVIEVVSAHATNSQLSRYRRALDRIPGEAVHTPFQRLKHQRVAVMYIQPKGEATGGGAQQLVRNIRDIPEPFEHEVGGPAATYVDLKATMTSNLLVVLIILTVTTILAVFLLTGSVVLPPKTVLMNTLTVAGALGVLVLVFQYGDPHWLLKSESLGSIAIIQPVLIVALAWGLSTDYGVFLLDRIREIHEDGASNEQAIALGLERTGRITTTAALLLCVAIGSLVSSRLPNARELVLGVVAAVLIDATIVRALLVPALMRLLGEANWWSPAPLRRLHHRLTHRSRSLRQRPDTVLDTAQQTPATVSQPPAQPAPEHVG